jgi:hypothetical protein
MHILLILGLALIVALLSYYLYCRWLNRNRRNFERNIARGLGKVRAIGRRNRKRIPKIFAEGERFTSPLTLPLKTEFDGDVLLTTFMPITFSLNGKDNGRGSETYSKRSSLIECYKPIYSNPSSEGDHAGSLAKDGCCGGKNYRMGFSADVSPNFHSEGSSELGDQTMSLARDGACCGQEYRDMNPTMPSGVQYVGSHFTTRNPYLTRMRGLEGFDGVKDPDTLTLWAVADTGSSNLVCTSDCCNCATQKYGMWKCSQPGKRENTEKDFDYGGGDYEGYYWDSTLSVPFVPDFEFAAMTRVKREDQGETVSICGLLPNDDGSHSGSKSFVDQIFESMDLSLPKSFSMDFTNFNITFGALPTSGKRVPFPSTSDLSATFGRHINYKFFYYMVEVKSLNFMAAGSASRTELPHPRYVVLDTGTTLLACGNKYTPHQSILNSGGVLSFEFNGPDGVVSLIKNVDKFDDILQNIPMLNDGLMTEIFICGLVMFIGKTLTFMVDDRNGGSYVQFL